MRWITVLAVALAAGCATIPPPPGGLKPLPEGALAFKRYVLGADILQVLGGNSMPCFQGGAADLTCSTQRYGETVAGVSVNRLSLHFYGRTLHMVSLEVSATAYEQLVSAFSEKYGEPEVREGAVSNAFGVTARSRTARYNLDVGRIVVMERCSITTACIWFESPEYPVLSNEFQKKAAQAAKNDM